MLTLSYQKIIKQLKLYLPTQTMAVQKYHYMQCKKQKMTNTQLPREWERKEEREGSTHS